MEQKRNETGRSMVEMLGVLAIIGVLSIGGIIGYSMAMNKHRANELMDGASKRAIVAMQQISLGATPAQVTLDEFANINDVGGGVFSSTVLDVEGGEIGIQVSNVEKRVCQVLAGMSGSDMSVVKVTPENEVEDLTSDDCSDTKENNTLAFVFGTSDGNSGGDDDSESEVPTIADGGACSKDGQCVSGKCGSSGTCLKTGGSDCSSNDECASGSCAENTFGGYNCVATKEGDSCSDSWECGYNYNLGLGACVCGKCLASHKSIGESCTKDCECDPTEQDNITGMPRATQICSGGSCRLNNRPTGSACVEDRECLHGVCSPTKHVCMGELDTVCIDSSGCIEGTCKYDDFMMTYLCLNE